MTAGKRWLWWAVNKSVVRLRREQMNELPPALRETLPHLPGLNEGGTVAVVCSGNVCKAPVRSAEELLNQLNAAL